MLVCRIGCPSRVKPVVVRLASLAIIRYCWRGQRSGEAVASKRHLPLRGYIHAVKPILAKEMLRRTSNIGLDGKETANNRAKMTKYELSGDD